MHFFEKAELAIQLKGKSQCEFRVQLLMSHKANCHLSLNEHQKALDYCRRAKVLKVKNGMKEMLCDLESRVLQAQQEFKMDKKRKKQP